MSCAIFKRRCFWLIVSSFGTNFTAIFLKPKSSFIMEWTDPMLALISCASSVIAIRQSYITRVFNFERLRAYHNVLHSSLMCGHLLNFCTSSLSVWYPLHHLQRPLESSGSFLLENSQDFHKILCRLSFPVVLSKVKIWLRSLTLPCLSAVCRRL